MFQSPFLGEITTEDARDEHELVLRDLINDAEFIELALAEEPDTQLMIGTLLRCARAHEQAWFERLQRKRITRLRQLEAEEARERGEQGEQS